MSENKLLSCPFCGGEAIVYRDEEAACIGCRNCCPVEPTTIWFDTLEEAAAAWNDRKPMEKIVERLEESSYWTECTFDEDGYSNDDSGEVVNLQTAIDIVKEEGISNGRNDL